MFKLTIAIISSFILISNSTNLELQETPKCGGSRPFLNVNSYRDTIIYTCVDKCPAFHSGDRCVTRCEKETSVVTYKNKGRFCVCNNSTLINIGRVCASVKSCKTTKYFGQCINGCPRSAVYSDEECIRN